MRKEPSMIDDIKIFFGIPPHDGPTNVARGDGYFMKSIEKKYGDTVENLRKKAGL